MIRNYTYAEQMSEYLFEFANNFYTGLRMEIVILLHTCSNPSSKIFLKKYIVSTIKTILDKTPSVSQAKKKVFNSFFFRSTYTKRRSIKYNLIYFSKIYN